MNFAILWVADHLHLHGHRYPPMTTAHERILIIDFCDAVYVLCLVELGFVSDVVEVVVSSVNYEIRWIIHD